jgi:hypothetical protein
VRRTVVAVALLGLVLTACASPESSGASDSTSSSTAPSTITSSTSSTTAEPSSSTTTTSTTVAAPSQIDRDAVLIMEFYDGWSTAVDEGQDVIEAYFAAHLYPDLPACAVGEKQLDVLTADRDTIRPADDWAITWGPLNGTVPEGRIYEVQLAEQTSLSHVSIFNDTVYVFWNCTGIVPADQFAFAISADPDTSTIVVDYANWYTGKEAVSACERDGYEACDREPGYYISNTNPRLRTLPVAPDAVIAQYVWLNEAPDDCVIATPEAMTEAGLDLERTIEGCLVSLEEFADYVTTRGSVFPNRTDEGRLLVPVWLAISDGVVQAIQVQYVP